MPPGGMGGMAAPAPARSTAPNPEFVATFPLASPTSNPRRFPSQWADHVVAGPKGAEAFITSDNCLGCHGGLGGGASGVTMFVPTGKKYGEGYNLSEYGEWRWSPMGLAGRDPIFHSQVESELALLDAEFAPTQAASAKTRTDQSLRELPRRDGPASARDRRSGRPHVKLERQAARLQLQARILQSHDRPRCRRPQAEGL